VEHERSPHFQFENAERFELFKPAIDKPSQLNSQQLSAYIKLNKQRGAAVAALVVALYRKYAEPFWRCGNDDDRGRLWRSRSDERMSWLDCVFQSWLELRFGEPLAGFNNWEHLECFRCCRSDRAICYFRISRPLSSLTDKNIKRATNFGRPLCSKWFK